MGHVGPIAYKAPPVTFARLKRVLWALAVLAAGWFLGVMTVGYEGTYKILVDKANEAAADKAEAARGTPGTDAPTYKPLPKDPTRTGRLRARLGDLN